MQFFKTPMRVLQLVYDSRNKSTSNLENLQHSDAHGIIVHPCKLLISLHDVYTQKALNGYFSYSIVYKNSIEGFTIGVQLQKQTHK